jgi:hypothetical protein
LGRKLGQVLFQEFDMPFAVEERNTMTINWYILSPLFLARLAVALDLSLSNRRCGDKPILDWGTGSEEIRN